MGPGFQGGELGSGVIIDKAKGYVVTNYPCRQGGRADHGPAGTG